MTIRTAGPQSKADPHLDLEAHELRSQGMSYPAIAKHQQCNVTTARDRARRGQSAHPTESPAEWRILETERLEHVIQELMRGLHTRHPVVSNGRAFPEYEDWTPKLACAREIRLYSETLRKLHGVDEPHRSRIDVVTDDVITAEIRRLEEQLAHNDAPLLAEHAEPALATSSGAPHTD